MQLLLENPSRRRSSQRRRRSSRRRVRRSRRQNPANPAPSGRRRRRSSRRRHGRRSSARRRNPFGGSGGGLMASGKLALELYASSFAGEFATALASKYVPGLRSSGITEGWVQVGVGVLGGYLLKKFGGPIRSSAKVFAAMNIARGLFMALPIPHGAVAAQKAGLGDWATNMGLPPTNGNYGLLGEPQNLYGTGDFQTDYNQGLPGYAG